MSALTAETEMIHRFKTLWADRCPAQYPNLAFDPPERTGNAEWVRVNIKDTTPEGDAQISIGSEQNDCRFTGLLTIQVFTNTDIGHAPAMRRAEEAAAIFLKWKGSVNGLLFRIPVIKEIGTDAEGWFQVNCIIAFIRNEII